ncbi:interleukin 21 receptor, tandem duplicate 1 [Thalassophryne amazonica]|uniref:interleukin 21 receptor, tandem duplicate 1 n=1 Tax=Thalassophryne amazonica TaxID=390379 RepID=UPI001470DFCE|nr:interleukin 21 receptor, tandem duplicate 1 [Thalassophryne amazonica]
MAPKLVLLLLLWVLRLLIHEVASLCNVTCMPDYNGSLNCSCSGSVLTHPVLLEVNCSDGDEEEFHDSCEVKPPQSWCMIYPAAFRTYCTARISQNTDQVITNASESSPQPLHDVGSSLCNVTCTTDYSSLLNCSCSGSVLTHPVRLEVNCSDGDEEELHDSCEVKPPQSWCTMYPETLYVIAAIGTNCTARVSHQAGQVIRNVFESSPWAVSDVVKPLPPFDVHVTNTTGFYNITWDANDQEYCQRYRVRIRESKHLTKDPVYSLFVEQKYVVIDTKHLQPQIRYTVDVQAKVCADAIYKGPWSEWSSSSEWESTGPSVQTKGIDSRWWYISLTIVLAIGLLILGYSKKPFLLKKFHHITYIPRPHDFFKTLDQSYRGNFKDRVSLVPSEYDVLMTITPIAVRPEKQQDVLQWSGDTQSCSKSEEMEPCGCFLCNLQPHCHSLLHHPEGDSLHSNGHSTGHISIHTVTLSGEELEEEATSHSSMNTLRRSIGEESFSSYAGDNRQEAGYDLGEPQMFQFHRQSGILQEDEISNDLSAENVILHPEVQFNEPERVSLDSFVSNEQSEDGYPRVDLDTIDSGFGECGSPVPSDSHMAEQTDSHLLHEHKNIHSNYVKQWMICSTLQVDSSNLENQVHTTQ